MQVVTTNYTYTVHVIPVRPEEKGKELATLNDSVRLHLPGHGRRTGSNQSQYPGFDYTHIWKYGVSYWNQYAGQFTQETNNLFYALLQFYGAICNHQRQWYETQEVPLFATPLLPKRFEPVMEIMVAPFGIQLYRQEQFAEYVCLWFDIRNAKRVPPYHCQGDMVATLALKRIL
jgi:hypothetical protein